MRLLLFLLLASLPAAAQQPPEAVPARPTVTTPANLTPVGYLQFEQGLQQASGSPNLDRQFSLVQVTKLSLNKRVQVQFASQPYARTDGSNDPGDLIPGVQFLLYDGTPKSKLSSVAFAYNVRVRAGTAPDLDIGSYTQNALLLLSGDLLGFHYDTNYLIQEQKDDPIRRAQFGQTLSLSHPITEKLSAGAELWHFTQPLVDTDRDNRPVRRANAVGLLLNLAYNLRPNLVVDAGFDRGLTSTSTAWEGFAGITYLLPHRLWPAQK